MKKTLHQFLSETTIPDHLLHKAEDRTWNHHGEVDSDTSDKIHAALGHKMFTTFPLAGHGENADTDVVVSFIDCDHSPITFYYHFCYRRCLVISVF